MEAESLSIIGTGLETPFAPGLFAADEIGGQTPVSYGADGDNDFDSGSPPARPCDMVRGMGGARVLFGGVALAVPEPGPLVHTSSGLGLVGLAGRRRRRARAASVS